MSEAQDPAEFARRTTGISIGVSLLLILLGLLALALPGFAGLAVAILVLWVIVFSGLAHLVHAWDARGSGDFLWRLLVGIVYLAVGVFLLLHPRESLASLTLVLVILFLLEAGMLLAAYFWLRRRAGSGWLLVNALLTGALGLLIGLEWPASSAWAIGMLVGVNILFSGFSRLMMYWSAHHMLKLRA
ncbi:MAG: DUF308 domain-containing protein [Gammaproteobacteria bacterium]|nr:DUF308 domain-containing protein [Gammaproteobacteria bacterium]